MADTTIAASRMTHRQTLEALSGLLMGMFVAILSSTIVTNALPQIISDLNGSQVGYTWVVTAALLAVTVSTPIWGKLSALYSKKLLVQLGLIIFVTGSALAGLAQNTGFLIACRAIQGIGAGALTALVQVVIAAMIPPRERGRYSGYIGAVFGIATVGGPLIGGVIVDTPALGWRWCFYVAVPFAIASFILLQKTLHLPVVKRENVKIDFAGATLITGGVSSLLIWVSLAGHSFAWASGWTVFLVALGVVLLIAAVAVENKAAEPVIPLRLFRNRTVTLAILASISVGVAMFGATVFLNQYFQLSRGSSPTLSGIQTIPLIFGLIAATTISGRLITKTGQWKRFLLLGGILMIIGFATLSTMTRTTPYGLLAVYMFLTGAGVGMLMQNLVLAAQNTLSIRDLGTGSSAVAFFRSLGGAVGVSTLGAVFAHRVAHYVAEATPESADQISASAVFDLSKLEPGARLIFENANGNAVGDLFLVALPFAIVAFIIVLFIKEVPLRTDNDVIVGEVERAAETAAPTGTAVNPVN